MSDSPRDVALRLITGIVEKRWAELPDLYAEDTVVEQPFNPDGTALRGRDALAKHFAAAPALPLKMAARDIVVHETTDPEVIVVEYDYDIEVTTTGNALTTANVVVMRVRDGRIVSSRDYHDHGAIAAAIAG